MGELAHETFCARHFLCGGRHSNNYSLLPLLKALNNLGNRLFGSGEREGKLRDLELELIEDGQCSVDGRHRVE